MRKITSYVFTFFVGIAVPSLSSMPTQAAILVVDDTGQLTGARGVDVNGVHYDVTFIEGSCVSLFDGCDEDSDLTFNDQASAVAAAQALLDQVLLDSPLGLFDTDPELTFGCGVPLNCEILIPFNVFSDDFALAAEVGNRADDIFSADVIDPLSFTNVNFNTANTTDATYVRFDLAATVPEPSTLPLFGLGLAGMTLVRQRRRLG